MRLFAILALVLFGCTRQPSESIYNTVEALLKQGDLKEALAQADIGLRAEPSWRFRLLKAEVLLARGEAQQALEVLRSAGAPQSAELRARYTLHEGQAKFLQSDYTGAAAAFRKAHDLSKSLSLPLLEAEIDLRWGALLVRLNQTDKAEESFRSALRIASERGDVHLRANALGNLGFLFLNTFHYDEAIYWLERARDAAEPLNMANLVAKALGNLGWCYYRLGDYDKALTYLGQAQDRSKNTGNRYEQQAWLGNMGSVLLDRGDNSAAIEISKKALEIARELRERYWTAWWLNNLALASINVGDFDSAERYNDEALRLKQNLGQSSQSYAAVNVARIAAGRRDFARAEKLYRALLAEPSDDPTPMLEAESGLAELLVETGDLDRADTQFRSAITRVETRRAGLTRDEYKLSYLSSLIRFYQSYVDFLVKRGQTGKALEVAESSRARVLAEKFGGSAHRSVSAATLQQLARSSGAVLLYYWLAPERSFLWTISPSGVTLHELPPEKQIASLVEGYRSFIERLGDPLQSEYPAGKKLAEILLGPARPLLTSGARVIVVPDRALHSLNMEMLPDPEDPSRYLIERVTLSVAPSLGMLTEGRGSARAAAQRPSLLLIGDPEPAGEEYPRLPYAAEEMKRIGENFPPDRRLVMGGAQAYAAAYREAAPERFSWIHFAAHASANRESPLDSALILSRHDSGYTLSARDVMNVALKADLVTLSACRSAGSKTYSGEGLVGLSWAFLRAGARSVVAGLWDVTDLSTARLMADFYGQLSNNAEPAQALRQAKLNLLHSSGAYRKPFYWGPFQLYVAVVR